MILLFVTVAAFAGRRVTIRLDGRPAMELIEAIEGQTGLRVLGDPAVLDSLTVTVDVRDAEPEQVLRDALRSASLFVTRYSNDLIITSEEELTASLPEGYFNAIVFLLSSYLLTGFFLPMRVQYFSGMSSLRL